MDTLIFLIVAVVVLAIAGYLFKHGTAPKSPSNFPGNPGSGSGSGNSDTGSKPGRPTDQS